MEDPKVLLIDDEPVFCGNFKAFMNMHKFQTEIATNGKDGIEKIRSLDPDIIVLDILMPNMDGYTMLREIRKQNVNIPCIVLTAREKLKDLFDVEHVARFLCKPIEMEQLKKNVEEVLKEQKEKGMSSEQSSKNEMKPTSGNKILLIEDDVALAKNIKQYLELKDYVVNLATNGEEGLEVVDVFRPDLIVSDVMMPEMDGFSMLKQLQKGRNNIPIIILTGKNKLKDLFEVEGIQGFISKPFELDELEKKIAEILNGE